MNQLLNKLMMSMSYGLLQILILIRRKIVIELGSSSVSLDFQKIIRH